jgi:hypothetical protein
VPPKIAVVATIAVSASALKFMMFEEVVWSVKGLFPFDIDNINRFGQLVNSYLQTVTVGIRLSR